MNRRVSTMRAAWIALITLVAVVATPLQWFPVHAAAGPQTVQITILHTNDFHGHLLPFKDKKMSETDMVSGAAYLAAAINKERSAAPGPVLLLDAGDIAQGTPVSNLFKGIPVVLFLNAMHYDAGAIGNHEFDWGIDNLEVMLQTAKFPVLNCNIVVNQTGKPLPRTQPYLIKDLGGVKVGIIGMVTQETPLVTKASNVASLRFIDDIAAAKTWVPVVRKKGADLIVLLSHDGVDSDKAMAQAVPGIDIIVGGHSHTVLKDPLVENGVIIVQAGSYGRWLGHLQLTVDTATKKIVSFTQKDELIPIFNSAFTPDPAVAALVEKYNAKVEPIMNQPAGEAAEDFSTSAPAGRGDTSMGDLLADAYRTKTGADVAFMNAGGVRATFNKGPITVGGVFDVMPFDNTLATMDLSGADVLAVLEHGAAMHGMVQVSGLTCTVDPAKPAGSRVTNVMVCCEPLDPAKTYRVTTLDFLVTGGDGYDTFKKGTNVAYADFARDVILEYVRQHSPIAPAADTRIVLTAPMTGDAH